jgi:hypothetical protein
MLYFFAAAVALSGTKRERSKSVFLLRTFIVIMHGILVFTETTLAK